MPLLAAGLGARTTVPPRANWLEAGLEARQRRTHIAKRQFPEQTHDALAMTAIELARAPLYLESSGDIDAADAVRA